MAAYTHIIVHASSRIEDLVAQTKEAYAGPLEIGEDLMSFDIGPVVTVRRADAPKN
jgi:ribonuclease Z